MQYVTPDEPWKVRDEDFPREADRSEQLRFLLNYAVLAPSVYNTQPWQFRVTGSEVALFQDRGRALTVSDPQGRNLIISCGAALFHLRMAARHFGYEAMVRTFPDPNVPNLLAYVRLGRRDEATREEHRLFAAIKRRRTIRSRFASRAVPAGMIQALQTVAQREGASLDAVQDRSQQQAVIDLIREAYEIRTRDSAFNHELERWTSPRWRKQPVDRKSDSPPSIGASSPPAEEMPRGLDRRQLLIGDEDLEPGAPAFVVLGTVSDDAPSWLSTGQALGGVLLAAADYGLGAAFLNLPLGIEPLRDRVRSLVDEDVYPQMLLRLGYGLPGKPTRRASVWRVLPER